ncbi:MAG: hypothetical protein JOZ07_08480 [Solirubrobacterales bacterium]|nr:hypothetical protein [Solirubrobacterales bacterium]
MSEVVALLALALALAASVARVRFAPDWAVAVAGALVLLAVGAIGLTGVGHALTRFGPTVGFLAALLVLGDGCRRAGLFDALASVMASFSHGSARRLLAIVFAVAAATTAVLSLDATVVLLTPIVFATASRLQLGSRAPMYACTHLANTASLLLPVSNLTNLLAFQAARLPFARFAALMALPWLTGLAIEWLVLRLAFRAELDVAAPQDAQADADAERRPLPRFALALLALTLAGFVASSTLGVAPVWVAVIAAAAITIGVRPRPAELVAAAQPAFLAFVLALAVIVAAAGAHGLSSAVDALLPHGDGLLALLAVAGVAAALANLANNLPATLIILPLVSASGPGPVLAMLVGVNIGPNLTYVGSLATLLWRRIVHAHDETVDIAEFTRLGALTVLPALVACTAAVWLATQVT